MLCCTSDEGTFDPVFPLFTQTFCLWSPVATFCRTERKHTPVRMHLHAPLLLLWCHSSTCRMGEVVLLWKLISLTRWVDNVTFEGWTSEICAKAWGWVRVNCAETCWLFCHWWRFGGTLIDNTISVEAYIGSYPCRIGSLSMRLKYIL